MDQDEYKTWFENLSERYAGVNAQVVALDEAVRNRQYRKTRTDQFLKTLKKQESVVTEFSVDLWHALADYATVYCREDVRFIFRNGEEIKGELSIV